MRKGRGQGEGKEGSGGDMQDRRPGKEAGWRGYFGVTVSLPPDGKAAREKHRQE